MRALIERRAVTLTFCPIANAFFVRTTAGWRRNQNAPDWALDSNECIARFIESWQSEDSSMAVLSLFSWLSWEQLDCLKRFISVDLEKKGISPLKERMPPQMKPNYSEETISRLIKSGSLRRILPKEIAELEDYDAVAAMWNAQTKMYDPLDPQHISVGEADTLRFRAKR